MSQLPGHDERPGVFGPSSLEELPRVIRELDVRRVLLLTGKASFTASGAEAVLPALRSVAAIETWSDFSPNPHVEDVMAGNEVVRSFQPDAIVAIGGGSVLDMAKLLAAFADVPAAQIPDAVRANQVAERTTALILVPTTSGSGSEATHFAVVYIGQEKFSVAHPALLPDFVIVDPTLTESASPYQKATSVIDAVAQAVESYWARGATESSRAFAHAALTELVPSARSFVEGDESAAVRAARGSYLAGRAIDLSKTTGAHALAYGLTSRHGVSHGHAVATTLGAFARLHADAIAQPDADGALQPHLESIATLIGADGVREVGDRLDAFAGELGLELKLGALGVPQSDLNEMASAVNRERLANNPVAIDEPEVFELLGSCW